VPPVEFVRIVNPKQPGTFLVLATRDFDPAVHTLFVEPPVSRETEPTGPVVVAVTTPITDVVLDRLADIVEANVKHAKATRTRKPKAAAPLDTAS
jgi:hypothetical protein